jgi:arabinogalactan oligomer/maltooligosaccharide transport system substrate-binding protein
MKKGFFLSTVALLSLGALTGCGGGGSSTEPAPSEESHAEDLNVGEVVVWCDEAIKDTVQSQLDAFKAAHPKYTISFSIEEVSESTAATQAISDPEECGDLYFFAQDQLSRLVSAGALQKLNAYAKYQVQQMNDAGSVKAATLNNDVYAYPATSDNGYFLYYDKSVFGNTDMTDFDAVAAAAKAAGKTIYYNYGSAWYNAAFFFAGGAHCVYELDEDGNFVDVDDTYDSAGGKAAAQALHELVKDKTVFVDDSSGAGFNKGAAAVISGTWDAATVKGALGDNMGATMLPKVKINGQATQLSSFAGFKLLGTKKQTTADRVIAVRELALQLTGEAAQKQRFEEKNWGPSNKNVQALPEVQADPVLKAIFAQNAVATPQGQYPNAWWSLAGALGTDLAKADADVNALIQTYKEGLPGTLD